jgi:hypothetical protein
VRLDDPAYLAARLKIDPEAAGFAPNVEAASVALRAQSEDWNLSRHAVQQTRTGLGMVFRG